MHVSILIEIVILTVFVRIMLQIIYTKNGSLHEILHSFFILFCSKYKFELVHFSIGFQFQIIYDEKKPNKNT